MKATDVMKKVIVGGAIVAATAMPAAGKLLNKPLQVIWIGTAAARRRFWTYVMKWALV